MWTPTKDQINTAEQREADALEQAWSTLRADRDARMAATDWVVTKSVETGEPIPAAWLEYRQALRDLPGITDDPANPAWPEKPE